MKKKYQFEFSPRAQKEFAAFEKSLQRRIIKKLDFFEKTGDPLVHALPLSGYEKYFRFRIGDYRLVVSLRDGVVVILVILTIAHRKEVYEKF